MVACLGWLRFGGSKSLWRRGCLSERGLSGRLATTTPYLRLCAIRLSWERLPSVERTDGVGSRCESYTHTAYVQFGFAKVAKRTSTSVGDSKLGWLVDMGRIAKNFVGSLRRQRQRFRRLQSGSRQP